MVNKIIYKINAIGNKLDIHTLEVIKKSSASMLVKIIGMSATFGISIILGHKIGPEGLGIINLANRIVAIVIVLAMIGMNNVILKEVAIAFERKDWHHVANTIYTAYLVNIPLALVISIIFIILTPWVNKNFFQEPSLDIPLIVALSVVVPQVLSRIFASGINGFRKIWQSSVVNDTLSSGVVVIGLVTLLALEIEITVVRVAILFAISRIVVTIAVGSYWKKLFKFEGKRIPRIHPMIKVAMPLLIVSATTLIASNADTVMLGWLSNARQVGFYSVAAGLGLLTSFFHILTASTLTPKIAALNSQGKLQTLQTMVQQVTKGLIVIGGVGLLIFFLGGEYILKLWGEEFSAAYWPLVIISIGQLFNIGTGATGIILIMTGHEKIVGYITLVSAVTNLMLNYFLIPLYGATGAAIATAVTVILENIIKVIIVKQQVNIYTIPYLK
ncbi:oligosaccharide flippase family protein [Carboxylicivirga linearis]|uniref:Oligosaccharide flippase family protein n=1 Tax=Carboxylicivirga linearis TaxID=1628157 RepID=A0ABS5JQF7_9BACT|nr:oligosaccharide flippase family protein [Carboxylicivirga linearis]MBS2097102.1 oligosaccharide flippase family protein [Carboxylicivirga linearis]